MFAKLTALLAIAFLLCGPVAAQEKNLTPQEQKAVIDGVSKELNEFYVFPETATKMQERIEKQWKNGAYKDKLEPRSFAAAIHEDLISVSKDKHLSFHYDPKVAEQLRNLASKNEQESKSAREAQNEIAQRDNFGFRKVERLAGNVGYLDFRYFAPANEGGEVAVAALNFLANCDAVIIDLRQNGGGEPTQIQLMSSFFFESPTHLNDIYTRSEDRTEHFWTLPYVPGKKLDKADLYILTSNFTFSGAEEFSYNMKNLKRATLIGETTGGGAHPTSQRIVQASYVISVPFARAINPITKTNWEGTGVTPDIEVASDQAFDKAYALAIEKLASKATDETRKNELAWVHTSLQSKLNPAKVSPEALQKYAGTYEERKVTLENGELFYQRTGPKHRLKPLTQTIFALEEVDYFRLEFVVQGDKAVEVVGLYDNGNREPSRRTSP